MKNNFSCCKKFKTTEQFYYLKLEDGRLLKVIKNSKLDLLIKELFEISDVTITML